VLFTGKETGEFIALDADTGKQLWQFQTGSGINAMAGDFHPKGPAVRDRLSGVGGLYWNIAREAAVRGQSPARGLGLRTFALMPN